MPSARPHWGVTLPAVASVLGYLVLSYYSLFGLWGAGLTGVPLGTLRYMSPDQLRAGYLSRSWDLWALAVIAYEVLCGIHPFAASDLASLPGAVLEANVTPVSSYLPEAPSRWQEFFYHALAPREKERPESVAVFWRELKVSLAPS
jgi:serine/threonine protein kinase